MYKYYRNRAAPSVGEVYCETKNVKGLSAKAMEVIGLNLQRFDDHDLDGNGTLDPQEILEKLKKDDHYGFATETDVENFLKEFDIDGNGKIDREEWIRKTVLRWANKTYIPQFLQVAQKGKVSHEDLVKVMADDGYDESELTDFLEKNGMSGDDVDFKTFVRMFFDVDART